jgi:hypothetical protein
MGRKAKGSGEKEKWIKGKHEVCVVTLGLFISTLLSFLSF